MLLIPFNSEPSRVFTCALGDGAKYDFETRWNEGIPGDPGFWTVDITRQIDQVKLLSGVPILLGQDILAPYALGIGSLIPFDEANTDVDAGSEDLGVRVNVYWLSAEEMAEAAADASA
jgi:hypothetical protein